MNRFCPMCSSLCELAISVNSIRTKCLGCDELSDYESPRNAYDILVSTSGSIHDEVGIRNLQSVVQDPIIPRAGGQACPVCNGTDVKWIRHHSSMKTIYLCANLECRSIWST
jgi:DNA-directed RNA polymerase subunit M/transcription elongation factor TFIIS